MMRKAFDIQVLRSIRGSAGRFLAILLIVALGCGFYAGLRMTGPDMRVAADAWSRAVCRNSSSARIHTTGRISPR